MIIVVYMNDSNVHIVLISHWYYIDVDKQITFPEIVTVVSFVPMQFIIYYGNSDSSTLCELHLCVSILI
jgi:hypothetical protein